MDRMHPVDPTAWPAQFQWQLLIRSNSTLTASPHDDPDGRELRRYLPCASKSDTRKIFLASPCKISKSVWDHKSGWKVDTVEPMSESDEYSMEDVSEDGESWHASGTDDDEHRPSSKALGKAKARSPSPALSFVSFHSEGEIFPPTLLPPIAPPATMDSAATPSAGLLAVGATTLTGSTTAPLSAQSTAHLSPPPSTQPRTT
ncbi:hypothetical protein B0H19DRAFT_1122118 [Mycena capillaripes]|nr:hypothetical protein B0H19DRAFT_1122118 [Mycena capillaripes]